MRVVIAGAGSVGTSIARELVASGHHVLVLDRNPHTVRPAGLPEVEWRVADACELSSLTEVGLVDADVVVAATGDDKVNLVVSFLARTEFAVPRTVARVNNPKNEWMFDETWGVDVAVSTPQIMTALVEEAVSVGDLVRILTFRQSGADVLEITLAADSPVVGRRVGAVAWPVDTVLACIIRDHRPFAPSGDDTLESGDELVIVSGPQAPDDELRRVLGSGPATM